jgi:hypothetical protein
MISENITWPVVLYSAYHFYVNKLDFIGMYPNLDQEAEDYKIKKQSAFYCNDKFCSAIMVRYEQINDEHFGFYTDEQAAIKDVQHRLEARLKEITK